MTDREMLEEFRQDMIREDREEYLREQQMYKDFDYAWDTLDREIDLEGAVRDVRRFIKRMEDYGWEVSIQDVFTA